MTSPARQWLIAALTHQPLPLLTEHFGELSVTLVEVVETAESEDVLCLLEHRLVSHPNRSDVPDVLIQAIQSAAKETVLMQLLYQAEQVKVFAALEQAGIEYIVMKGSALGRWLYESPSYRPISDIDLWLPNKAVVFALESVLGALGYVSQPTLGHLTTHEHAYDKDLHGLLIRIDAHWSMFNSAVLTNSPRFDEAYGRALALSSTSAMGRMLCMDDALINSIGHRALKYLSNNGYSLKWLFDLHLMFKRLDAAQWQNLLTGSSRFGISDLSVDALQVCSAQLGTPIPADIIATLQAQARHEPLSRRWFQSWWRYQRHEFLASAPDWSTRIKYIWQKLWPNPDAVRERYGKYDPAWKLMLKRLGQGIKRLFS